MGIKILTDSTSYLSDDIVEELGIEIISLSVLFGDESYKETEITNEEFFEKLKNYKEFPKSSQPSLSEVTKLYNEILSEGDDLICVFLSSDMSGTFSTSMIIKNEMLDKYPDRKMEIIDSRSNSMQLGMAVIAGGKAIQDGKKIDEIIDDINKIVSNSRFVFMPDTLEYLKKGGRIGAAQALLGSVMQIKPILTVEDGVVETLAKVRTRKKAIQFLMNKFKTDLENNELLDAYVHHINCEEDAKKLAERIEKDLNIKVKIGPIGPVIGTHVGPGTIGIVYSWR